MVANLFTCPVVPDPGDASSSGSQDSQQSVFVAPEVQGGGHYTRANDIYAFGVLMWVLLTGRPVRDKLCAPRTYVLEHVGERLVWMLGLAAHPSLAGGQRCSRA